MNFRDSILLILISFAVQIALSAQVPQLSYRQYTVKDGLIQQQVLCIFEDSRGFIWAGTKGGLSRYDGENFVNYRKEDGLPSTYISKINEDSKGNLWLISGNKYLLRFDGLHFSSFDLDSLITNENHELLIDKGDNIYVGVQNKKKQNKVLKFQQENFHIIFDESNTQNITDTRLHALTPEKDGLLIVGKKDTFPHIAIYQNDTLISLPVGFKNSNYLHHFNDKIYLTGNEKNKDAFALSEIDRYGKETIILDNLKAFKIYIDSNGNLWEYKFYSDSLIFHPKENYQLSQTAFKKSGISINTMLQTKDKTFWLGTEEGLVHFSSLGFYEFDGKLLPNTWTIVEGQNEEYFFGGYGKGLRKWDGTKITYLTNYLDIQRLKLLDQQSRLAFPNEKFYMGAIKRKNGDLIFPASGGVLGKRGETFFTFNYNKRPSPRSTSLFVYEDTTRNLIFSGEAKGVRIFDNDGNLVRYINQNQGLHKASFILSIAQDKYGHFWFGSGGGLSHYDFEKDTVINNYLNITDRPNRVGVISICKDDKNTMWFGTTDGIWFYDEKNDSIILLANEINGSIGFVYPMESQHLLIGKADGLYVLDLAKYYQTGEISFKIFNYNNGFNGAECGQNGIMKDSKGQYWITTSDKVIRMNPKYLDLSSKTTLQTMITQVNGVQQSLLCDTIFPMTLKEKNTIINFISIGTNRPQETNYAYRLNKDGKLGQWSAWQKEKYAILTDLEDGQYEFEVKAGLMNQQSSQEDIAKIIIPVDVAFYKEAYFPWYVFSFGVLSALGIYLFHKRKNQQLQNVAEQNKQNAEYLQIQALQAQLNPHFLNNSLSSLGSFVLKKEKFEAYDRITKLGQLMRGYMEASINSSLNGTIEADLESTIPLRKIVGLIEKYVSMEALQFDEALDFHIDCSEALMDAHLIPPFIIQPYVENAIIHGLRDQKSIQRELFIRFWEEADALVCTVEDNGIGLEASRKKRQSALQRRVSYGTNLVKRRIVILKKRGTLINVDLKERKEGGTIATITFKLQKQNAPNQNPLN